VTAGRRIPVVPVLIALAFVGAACATAPPASQGPVQFRAERLDNGTAVSLADLRGRPALLTSWAVWCPACIEELPALETFWSGYKDDLAVVAVNIDGSRNQALRRARQDGLTMAVWHDPDNVFSRVFHLVGIPSWVMLDADGRTLHVGVGAIDFSDPTFEELIRTSVGGTTTP
jgi:thiol-disulfide isomerase/thioredoxin